uniref:DUF19 domain-containing protein n=1 Tax=Romanomermis culicivorax TaxID=13658 RepID=A0A915J4K1_ROMCU
MDDALIFKCSPTKPSEVCSVELTKQCEKFRLNFISITSNPIKDYCSAEQLLETCIACNAVNLPSSVTSIHNFVCGPGANDYQKSRTCLFSALDDQNVKSCFKIEGVDDLNNVNDTSTICPTANKLVNCTLPIIDRLCGGMSSQFHMN